MMQTDPATLRKWAIAWEKLRSAANRELVASYTPEQRAIIARRTEAARQGRLCWARLRFPAGGSGEREDRVGWPDAPPTD